MSQLPPGFVLDDPAPAPAKAGPIYGAPPKPEKPEQPKTTYRPMTADEVTARGLPPGSYQISSDGKIDTVAPTAKPNPGEGFEIGPDGVAKPIPGGKADTLANQRRGALAVLNAAGIDAATGYDPVAPLIQGSTSGFLEKFGADTYGALTGDATTGMENIGRLKTLASTLTLQLMNGSLGTGISNADRDFIVEQIGDIANPSAPADQRLAAWDQVKQRMINLTKPEEVPEGNVFLGYGKRDDGSTYIVWGKPGSQLPPGATPVSGNSPPPSGGGLTLNNIGLGIGRGVGDIVQTGGDFLGVVANPITQAIYNAIPGDQGTADLGKSLRQGLGLPDSPDNLATAVNRGGAAALMGAGLARGATLLAQPGVMQNALRVAGEAPLQQMAGGAGAGAGSEAGKKYGVTGQVLGGLAGGMAGYGAGGVPGMIKNALTAERTPGPLLAAADRQKIDLMPADAGGTGTRMASGVIGRTLGEIPMQEGATASLATATNARNRVAADIGTVFDETGAGQAAKKGANAFVSQSEARAGQLYDAIPIAPDTRATLTATRSKLADITRGFTSNPTLSKIWANHQQLRDTLTALTPVDVSAAGRAELETAKASLESLRAQKAAIQNSVVDPRRLADLSKQISDAEGAVVAAAEKANRPPEGGELSWEDMKRLRSIVGQIVGDPSLTSDGNAKAAMRAFYGALSKDMEATASQAGPKALDAFKKATRYWRGREDRIDNVLSDILGSDLKKGDTQAFEQINSWAQRRTGNFNKLARSLRSMPSEEAATVRASLIGRMGQATPGRQNADGLAFSPAEFSTQWARLSDRAKSVLFPNEQHRADLNDLALVFNNMKRAGQYSNTSMTTLGANATAHIGGAIYGGPVGALLSAGVAGGEFALGKLLASPRFARLLASTPVDSGAATTATFIQKLGNIAKAEPIIANDIKSVQTYLQQAAASSPGRAAAQDETNGRRKPPQQ